MFTGEPAIAESLDAHRLTVPSLYVGVVGGVLWTGFVRNRRRLESRIRARLASFGRHADVTPCVDTGEGDCMRKILVSVDDSPNSARAVRHVIAQRRERSAMEVHLLNVQAPFPTHISRFFSRRNLRSYHRGQSREALRPIQALLDGAGVPHTVHMAVGRRARVIVETARRLGCDRIVMGTARQNSLTRMVEASVTNEVLELTPVPVEVVAGDAVSRLERYGIPAAVATAVGLLAYAIN
jgi:nucleotide-binding universal stress UspA family protein